MQSLRVFVLFAVLLGSFVSVWPSDAVAQSAITPASQQDVLNLTFQVANLTNTIQMGQANESQLLSTIESIQQQEVSNVAGATASLNATIAQLSLQMAQQSAALTNATLELQAILATLSGQFTAFGSKLDAIQNSIAMANASSMANHAETLNTLVAMDQNMTSDHVKLYSGLFDANPSSPNVGKPFLPMVIGGQVALGENQAALNNKSDASSQAIITDMTGFHQQDAKSFDGVNANVASVSKQQGHSYFLLWVFFLGFVAVLAYVFGPTVWGRVTGFRSNRDTGRRRQTVGIDEDEYGRERAAIVTDSELDAAVREAKRQPPNPALESEEVVPTEAPPSPPRRPAAAPRPRVRRYSTLSRGQ